MLTIRRKWGWGPVLTTAWALSLAVLVLFRHNGNIHAPGYFVTWILCWPIWIYGAILAEKHSEIENCGSTIWLWRLGIGSLSVMCLVLRFHESVDYEYTSLIFGPVVYFWIRAEIGWFRSHASLKFLEAAGKASFTIYLVHVLAFDLAVRIGGNANAHSVILLLASVMVLSATFYLLIEKPSHELARRLGRGRRVISEEHLDLATEAT